MNVKVVDASILAAVIFCEPSAEEAAMTMQGCKLLAPYLLPYEIANVSLKKMSRQGMPYEHALQSMLKFDEFEVKLMEVDPVGVLEAAHMFRLSAYDASYLWLARNFDCELVTLDARLKLASQAR